jgi:hypothetical protein
LKEPVGGVRVIGEIADLVDAEELRPGVVAQPPVEAASGLLAIEVEADPRR